MQDVVLREALLSEGARELYERTLEMSCRYLVEIATTLPRFEADSLVEVLRRERVILETVNRILGQMPANRRASDFTTDFCRVLERQLDRMELFGVTLLEESSRVYPLTVSYVNLTLLQRGTTRMRALRLYGLNRRWRKIPSAADRRGWFGEDDAVALDCGQSLPVRIRWITKSLEWLHTIFHSAADICRRQLFLHQSASLTTSLGLSHQRCLPTGFMNSCAADEP